MSDHEGWETVGAPAKSSKPASVPRKNGGGGNSGARPNSNSKPPAKAEAKADPAPVASAVPSQAASESDSESDAMSKTIFHNPDNFSIKHPLESTWVLWYDKPSKKTPQVAWNEQLKKVSTLQFVEDFWSVYNVIKPPSQLKDSSNYHLFKDGIQPAWEDKNNERGGKWVISITKHKPRQDIIDEVWLNCLLAVIGEALCEYSDAVCGVVVSLRPKQDRIALWTRNADNSEQTVAIGRKFKEALGLPPEEKIGFQVHDDAKKRGSSFNNKNRYEL